MMAEKVTQYNEAVSGNNFIQGIFTLIVFSVVVKIATTKTKTLLRQDQDCAVLNLYYFVDHLKPSKKNTLLHKINNLTNKAKQGSNFSLICHRSVGRVSDGLDQKSSLLSTSLSKNCSKSETRHLKSGHKAKKNFCTSYCFIYFIWLVLPRKRTYVVTCSFNKSQLF